MVFSKSQISIIFTLILSWLFYNMFQNTKYSFSNMVQKVLFSGTVDVGSANKYNVLGKFLNIISGFFSPFLVFFKIIFMFVYPFVLFHYFWGFINYSSYASSFLVKFFCFFGIAYALLNFLSFILEP